MTTSARKTVFITGANRGLGFGLAERYLASGAEVFVTARNPDGARELWELEHGYTGRCHIIELDVGSGEDLSQLSVAMRNRPLDLLINNAGVLPPNGQGIAGMPAEAMLKAFTVNTLGPLRVTQNLLPCLLAARAPVVATISSLMGSIADNSSGGACAYRTSKAAVNMVMKTFAIEFPQIAMILLHPGWVKTDMGGSGAKLSVLESVEGMVQVLNGVTAKDSGQFIDFRGKVLPW